VGGVITTLGRENDQAAWGGDRGKCSLDGAQSGGQFFKPAKATRRLGERIQVLANFHGGQFGHDGLSPGLKMGR
jgi:hypothetical protein